MAQRNYYKRLMELTEVMNFHLRTEKRGTREHDRWFECQKILLVVVKYALNRGNKPSSRQKVQTYWGCGCNFDLAVEKLGVSYDVLRGAIARDSRLLYAELGSAILELLQDGKPVDAHIEFVIRTNSLVLSDVIPADIVPLLPEPSFDVNINLEDCIAELKILKAISFISIKDCIARADTNKLCHILAILKGDGDYGAVEMQKKLWGYLIGKDELKTMLNDLKTKSLIE